MDQAGIKEVLAAIEGADNEAQLQELRVKYLGRKGVVTEALKSIGQLPADQRAKAGAEGNKLRQQIEDALQKAQQVLGAARVDKTASEYLDLTAPVPLAAHGLGHLHPVNELIREWVRLFWQMGYEVIDGPEIESEWYNFEALNIGPDHPARDMQDTFYLEGGNLPRTHTSNMQIRYMESHKPPIRIISPGKVYRNEDEDARHAWMFYQVEGLVVDKGISLSDLKGTMLAMARALLGEQTEIKLLPNYFPYVEPAVELHATCVTCGGKGGDCPTCSGTGWLELGGAGMVHPQVLKNVGIDPSVYSGFAFGFGPERVALLKYGVNDIREFWRPNLKFLEQF